MKFLRWLLIGLTLLLLGGGITHAAPAAQSYREHSVAPGDTWTALHWQYDLPAGTLQTLNPHPNSGRQPAIGSTLFVPAGAEQQQGHLLQTGRANLLVAALTAGESPWSVALRNGLTSPFHVLPEQPLFVPDKTNLPRVLPPGMRSLELSRLTARPGQAIGLRGQLTAPAELTITLDGKPLDLWQEGDRWIGLTGTGAFYGTRQPELIIRVNGRTWTQPWYFQDLNQWEYQQLTLTGSAAEIDAASIAAERERLFAIWEVATPGIQWQNSFQLPVTNYLSISSDFGVRRSYNGGPYSSYHEGVDFSAYGGTPVYAPAAGNVVIAEFLYVRGGAVIIDHGLGVYSGYYHLSDVSVAPGQPVAAGDLLGAVGTTGLSTGNHLHWDLLVNATWVDAWAWFEQDMGCWLLAGLGRPCP